MKEIPVEVQKHFCEAYDQVVQPIIHFLSNHIKQVKTFKFEKNEILCKDEGEQFKGIAYEYGVCLSFLNDEKGNAFDWKYGGEGFVSNKFSLCQA